ncbi:ornithine racemase Orr [Liberiplasma polymorphum]|uniref:ornithine racemase Orr n=1 Tax=Liberiplasma polymorphum TaxID=3374570 RepID=UPI0037754C51
MYPKLIINLKKYKENVDYIHSLCNQHGITVMAVTKVFCADNELVNILNHSKIEYIADSRIENLRRIRSTKPKVLLRIPSLHEIEEVVNLSDISLNSEIVTIRHLNEVAKKLEKTHSIILMIDIGDLREGLFYKENIHSFIEQIMELSHINLKGIGTNLSCFGGIIPEDHTLKKLVQVVETIKEKFNINPEIVSGGNSSHLHLLLNNEKIPYVNNLRLGESLILGRETAYGENIEHTFQDVIILEADLIEVKLKPSIPEGTIGMNAFGKIPTFDDLGLMKRGILALGKQDVDFHELIPVDQKVRLIGSSSDHIIVDLTHTDYDYKVGDILKFELTYGSLLGLMTSKYVKKDYIK